MTALNDVRGTNEAKSHLLSPSQSLAKRMRRNATRQCIPAKPDPAQSVCNTHRHHPKVFFVSIKSTKAHTEEWATKNF